MSAKETKLQKYSAPALEKGLDILEFLSVTNEKPNLSQLAAGIGRSKNEIFRMMIVLEERGYIERLDGELFTLTEKLAHVGSARSDVARLADIARPYLEQLSDETALSNSLSIRQASNLLTVAATDAAGTYGLSVRVGYQHSIFGTAAGACFLATEPDTFLPDAVQSVGAGQSEAAKAAFLELVNRCRQDDFAEAPNPEHNAILEIAAPVCQASEKKTIAAISIPIIKSAESPNRLSEVRTHLLEVRRSLQEKISLTLPGQLQLENV